MLPIVLGGIALAAVGYGVKEFCESEGCPWDEECTLQQDPDEEQLAESSPVETLSAIKEELRDGVSREIDVAFGKLDVLFER